MGKLKQKADEFGEDLKDLIPRLITEEGSLFGAAKKLDVYPNSITFWLKRNGYRLSEKKIVVLEKDNTSTGNEHAIPNA